MWRRRRHWWAIWHKSDRSRLSNLALRDINNRMFLLSSVVRRCVSSRQTAARRSERAQVKSRAWMKPRTCWAYKIPNRSEEKEERSDETPVRGRRGRVCSSGLQRRISSKSDKNTSLCAGTFASEHRTPKLLAHCERNGSRGWLSTFVHVWRSFLEGEEA